MPSRYQPKFGASSALTRLALAISSVAGVGLMLAACARRPDPHGVSASGSAPRPAAQQNNPGPVQLESSGEELYLRYCKLCHAADGTGYAADNAPSLVSRTFLESATDEFIARGIAVGRPNTAMAAYAADRGGPLSTAQIERIVSFLRTKGPPPLKLPEQPVKGDPDRGGRLFDQHCSTCHGNPTTKGDAPELHNPELLASASPEFLRYAIVHGRPPTPMPAFGDKLAAEEIEDVLAWLAMLPRAPPQASPVGNPSVPADLPLVIHPKGAHAKFKLRDGRFVSSEQVKNALAAKQRLILLDARSPSDWIQFRIPGSVPIPYYDRTSLDRIPNDGTWVVAYCACPHHASGEVVDALRQKGHENAAVLDEGILFWRERGYPLEGEAIEKNPPAMKRP